MPKLEVVRLGHPALRRVSRPVDAHELGSADFQKFLDDLADTCRFGNGVGIAAPQVGINKRVIVVHVDPANPRYPGKRPFPLTIIINPVITGHTDLVVEDWEGDMSAGIRALVPRWNACTVEGTDRRGHKVEYGLDYDFHARVFQHEIDHLDGKFFIDHVIRKDTISEIAEWELYWKNSAQ
jgi:peptide deformylase